MQAVASFQVFRAKTQPLVASYRYPKYPGDIQQARKTDTDILHRLLQGLAATHTKTTLTIVELQLLNTHKQHYQAADVVKE